MVSAEPKAVADMTAEQRRAALLTHLCHMQVGGTAAAAVAVLLGQIARMLRLSLHSPLRQACSRELLLLKSKLAVDASAAPAFD